MATTQKYPKIIGITAVIVAVLLAGIYAVKERTVPETAETEEQNATSTESAPSGKPSGAGPKSDGMSGYANAEYGFSLRFPPYVRPTNFFTTFHELSSNWRLNASAANQGKAVVEFPIFSVDQGSIATGKNYPLYYMATLRVGVSPNVKECYTTDAGYADQKVSNVTIYGVTWKRFDWQGAATMRYVEGRSYRTIHNNMCYVMEQVRNGSNYRDDTMKPGTSDTTLQNYYDIAGDIAKTFKFTK